MAESIGVSLEFWELLGNGVRFGWGVCHSFGSRSGAITSVMNSYIPTLFLSTAHSSIRARQRSGWRSRACCG